MSLIHSVLLFERNGIGIQVSPSYDLNTNQFAVTVTVYLPRETAYIPFMCNTMDELIKRMSEIKNDESEREELLKVVTDKVTNSNQQPDNEKPNESPNTRTS